MTSVRLACFLAAFCASAFAQDGAWTDTRENRMAALALIRNLNSEILASRSATQTLQKWCGDHKLADPPEIVARVFREIEKAPSPEQRRRLDVGDDTPVKYRRVELRCGDRVLSVADNWYVPGRLTAEMNRLLETTGTPFGTAVRGLEPYRKTLSERLLWSPAAESASAGAALSIPDALFEHRAVLYTREHVPFSEVNETYQRQLLAFPPVARP